MPRQSAAGPTGRLFTLPARVLLLACLLGLAACQTAPSSTGFGAGQKNALRNLGFSERADGWDIGLAEKILFDVDTDRLSPDAVRRVESMGRTLLGAGIVAVRVEGYTDNSGPPAYNEALSLRRATAVAVALAGAGMPRSGITTRGLGATHPVGDNATAAGRTENRRVAVIVPVPLP